MKYTIMGFSQAESIKYNLDVTDLLLLRWVADLSARPTARRIDSEGHSLVWVNYATIIEDMPIIAIKKRALFDRLSKMVEKGLLYHYFLNTKGGVSFYGLTENADALVYPMQSTAEGYAVECRGGMQSTAEKLNTNIPEEKKETTKESGSKIFAEEVVEMWNTTCTDLPKVVALTPARIQHICARAEQMKQYGHPIQIFREIMEYLHKEDFYSGRGEKAWKNCTFDWLVDSQNKWATLLEKARMTKPVVETPAVPRWKEYGFESEEQYNEFYK